VMKFQFKALSHLLFDYLYTVKTGKLGYMFDSLPHPHDRVKVSVPSK
jgi:hypothetical protein